MYNNIPFSKYDVLDSEQLSFLEENVSNPWQRSFIERFHFQLNKQGLNKAELCNKVSSISDRLDKSYTLNLNTLSQYTKFDGKNLHPICVNALIAISCVLGVSIDYLLGIDECETKENTDIFNATGLSNDAIDILKKNEPLQKLLDVTLVSSHIPELLNLLSNIFLSDYISSSHLKAYSNDLQDILLSSFNEYESTVLPLDRCMDDYKKILIKNLPIQKIKPINQFLRDNLSYDIYLQISFEPVTDNNLYNRFIDFAADHVYEILVYKSGSDSYRSKLFSIFNCILDEYYENCANNLSQRLKNVANSAHVNPENKKGSSNI